MIKSFSFDEQEILHWILDLHCKTDIQLDPTFSKGNFYKTIPEPVLKFDISPIRKDVVKANSEHLPLKDNLS